MCCCARPTSVSSREKFHSPCAGSTSFQATLASHSLHVPNGTAGHGVPGSTKPTCIPKYCSLTGELSGTELLAAEMMSEGFEHPARDPKKRTKTVVSLVAFAFICRRLQKTSSAAQIERTLRTHLLRNLPAH
ncbi:hypothetical protein SBA5_890005 [Candidatus Sulfotelmatomonas gaucii]|uniref:Uncharacterized protein n=1 Tax=Candidatus Sulfuritelmatomonas gaucii TaxID=2043161 RepID=A0A2N9M7V4_9BACT|nr:hypothetical protein SBA5_890005 [Candidatus Sulfotelmatomonas gaucii]